MRNLTLLLYYSGVFLTLNSVQLVFCKKKPLGNKSFKKLSKSEVQVKTYLFPCSFDKEILNASFGSSLNHLHKCKRKFVIRMTVNSGGEYCSKTDGFIPIDHVIDAITGRKKRLLNPFMVRLKREKMYQLYDLQLVKSVNAEAREEVLNHENTPNYTGCDTSSSHPTCGFSFFNNKIIQFSEGFCCSCDQNKNDQRQPCEGNAHENKDFPDMEYAVHRHRSNRTSRDLETPQQKLDTLNFDFGNSKQQTANLNIPEPMLNSEFAKPLKELDLNEKNIAIDNNIDVSRSHNQPDSLINQNVLQSDTCEDFKPVLDNDNFWTNNVTVKTFEFEHSLDSNIGRSFSLSPFNIKIDSVDDKSQLHDKQETNDQLEVNDTKLPNDEMALSKTVRLEDSAFDNLSDMEGDLNEYFDAIKHSENKNNPIDREKFKLLVMKRIKDNKNKEELLMNRDSDGNETINQVSSKGPRDIKINPNCSGFQRFDYANANGKNGISLKIENDNSELRLQIITKKPKNATMNKEISNGFLEHRPRKTLNHANDSSPAYDLSCMKEDGHKTSSPEQTTKKGIKQRIIQNSILKYFQSGKNKKITTGNPKMLSDSCNKTTTPSTDNLKTVVKNSEISTSKCVTPLILNDSKSLFLPLDNFTKINSFCLNKNGTTKNTSDIEGLMYKLIPVINTVHNLKSIDSASLKKADGIVKDTDNATYNVYIELKKKSDQSNERLNKKSSLVKQSPAIITNRENSFELQSNLMHHNPILSYEYDHKNVEKKLEEEPTDFSEMQLIEHPLQSNVVENQIQNELVQNIKKREATCDTQIRGGQSCEIKGKTPCNANLETYLESAHCLRFSDLWYNVFKLLNPRLENSITVKIYAKHKTPDKRICWENLTKRLPGRVGTINEVLTDDAKNIMITYSSDDKVAYSLDCLSNYILVPQPLPRRCKDAELKVLSYGGPEEYLVLKENQITFDGEECDKAGVNYGAFARQLHRCQQEAGSCLKNQPLHYWRKDKEAGRAGKGGHYFLKNFIEVTEQAILQNTTSNQVVLRAPYFEKYQSQVVIEMNADHIEIIGDKTEGQISEVYTDATSEKVTIVRAVVTNMGIAADFFGVDFANCSSRLGPSDFDKPGKDEIPPQHRITYTATISSPLKNKRVECRMVLYNQDHEVVASRHIVIVQGHRCMCVWYCQCVCYNHPNPGLPCNPLTVTDYNRAGFPGHLPVTVGSNCSTFFSVLHALLWFFMFLLLFGLIKAILGLCLSIVALWGLWYLLPGEAKNLQVYLEPQYACCPVVRDCDGFPIHPRTYKRTDVHFLPWYSEFIVNVFFFICVFRSWLCDHGSYRGSPSGLYYQDPCYSWSRGRNRCCSPNCSPRHRSPCGSVCSNRRNRKFRVSAGAEEEFLNPDPQLLKDDEWAKRLVDELTRSYVVFRVLTRPMGGVKSVPGTPYCVRGFFLESENGVYEFTPPSPLMQIWQMNGSPLDPPLRLDPTPFHALYRSAREVLGAHELSPWARGVVINAP